MVPKSPYNYSLTPSRVIQTYFSNCLSVFGCSFLTQNNFQFCASFHRRHIWAGASNCHFHYCCWYFRRYLRRLRPLVRRLHPLHGRIWPWQGLQLILRFVLSNFHFVGSIFILVISRRSLLESDMACRCSLSAVSASATSF